MAGSPFDRWMSAVRRRVRLRRGLRALLLGMIVWGVASAALLTIARIVPLGWVKPLVFGGAIAGAVIGLIAGLLLRLPSTLAARSADRELNAADRLTTASELGGGNGDSNLAGLQVRHAHRLASGVSLKQAAPIRLSRKRVLVALSLAVAVTLLVALPNPKEAVAERRRTASEALKKEADAIKKKAAEVRASAMNEADKKALAQELEKLAERLKESGSIERGLEEIIRAEAKISELTKDDDLQAKTLLTAASRSLEQKPLADGADGDLEKQLEKLAELQSKLGTSEAEEATERLESLSQSLSASDTQLSEAMDKAAKSLRSGEQNGALSQAASSAAASKERLRDQDAVASARASLGESRSRLGGTEGTQESRPGTGQSGSGSRDSPGASGSGNKTGATSGPAGGSGGREGGTGGAGVSDSKIYDPVFGGDVSDQLGIKGDLDESGQQRTIGKTPGPQMSGSITVPYRFVYPQWSSRAARSVESMPVPASMRSFVRSYFASLDPDE